MNKLKVGWKSMRWLAVFFLMGMMVFSTALKAEPKYWVYTFDSDDNLWDITFKYSHLRYWKKIQKLNGITKPRQLPPGTRVKIPLAWLNVKNAQVEVIEIQGQPIVTAKNKPDQKVSAGYQIKQGNVLVTKEEENVLLEFIDDSRMLLKENTQVKFDSLLTYNTTGIADSRMSLDKGSIENFVQPNKTSAGTHYQVTTPSAVMAVRGTEYRIKVSDDQQVTHSEVLEGKVKTSGSSKTRIVLANTGTVIKQGESPTLPVKLLPALDLSTMEKVTRKVPVRLPFQPIEQAQGYRIEIAENNKFTTLLYDDSTKLPIVRGPNLPEGHYSVRIRGIDSVGLEGQNAVHQFEVNARPLAPFTVMPVDGVVVREQTPTFKWTEADGVVAYHFQLAKDLHFSNIIIDQPEQSAFEFQLESLESGEYFWRVASIDELKEQGPFGDAIKFTLKPSPASPEMDAPEIGESELVLRWRKGEPGQKYHFQLADDEVFDNIVEDMELTEPFVKLPILSSGTYYMRVSVIDTDGYRGEFGDPQTIDIPHSAYWYLMLLILTPLFILI